MIAIKSKDEKSEKATKKIIVCNKNTNFFLKKIKN
jgi:hypothetical protein